VREEEVIRRRDLPHWDVPGATYFVTACLEGSIPAQGLLDIKGYRAELQKRQRPQGTSELEWKRTLWKLEFARVDHWLDLEPAARHLGDPALARIVTDSLLFFAGARCDVYAFVVMPSHFHWVFAPCGQWVATLTGKRTARERLPQSVKGYSSRLCNAHRGVSSYFWQE
jgi:type I restriction enzyme R subunit